MRVRESCPSHLRCRRCCLSWYVANKCCGVDSRAFRGTHRVASILLLGSLCAHGWEHVLSSSRLWLWMLLLLAVFLVEYIGFHGWFSCRRKSHLAAGARLAM